MPWLETAPVEQRLKFIDDVRSAQRRMTQLCARYGISRKTGYKWLARYADEGRRGLGDRSRTFKGQFPTGDGIECSPLTIADQHTRFLLSCSGLLSTQTVTAR